MPTVPGVNSRRAQTLVAVREMVLRGEFTPRRAIEQVELSKALGASRPIVRATLEILHQEGLLEELSAGVYAPRVFSAQDIADAIDARGALEGLAAGLAASAASIPPNWPGFAGSVRNWWKKRHRSAQRNLPLPIRWRVLGN